MTRGRAAVVAAAALVAIVGLPVLASAQSAAIGGRIVDEQGLALVGAIVTVSNPGIGFSRTTESDAGGLYRIAGLQAGIYDITAARDGFATMTRRTTIVEVGADVRIDFPLHVAAVAETVDVAAPSPLVRATAVVGGVVETRRINELPLNGRQFANLAATLPGIGIGFHKDPTKRTQYTPQVLGGAGRNVNYLVDGGDNNDDTVGGQLQMFPLDAIEEFRFSIASYGAATGRAAGGTLSVVTRSGTNQLSGSGFTFFRDDALNARTTTEIRNDVPKSDYRRWQYGGSIGGPIVRDRAHFFGAFERVQQDTFQPVDTLGLFPALNGVFAVPYRESLIDAKATVTIRQADRAWLRYGGNLSSQPFGAAPTVPIESWGDSRNRFHSINGNYTSLLGRAAVNEVTLQYSAFMSAITTDTTRNRETFPNGVVVGVGLNVPQFGEQRKFHFSDDVTWHLTGRGRGHDIKTGVSLAYDPQLGFPPSVEPAGFLYYVHLTNDPRGSLSNVSGNTRTEPLAFPELQTPLTQTGVYAQDDWRVTDRLTVNAGVRYDLSFGYALDQSKNANFVRLQEAGRTGRLNGIAGLEDFGKTSENDTDNIQPRVGFAYNLDGQGRDIVRGGWGIYTDQAYTNANILFAAVDAQGNQATGEFVANDPAGLRNPDGSFFRVGDPISNIARLNEGGTTGLNGVVVTPRLEQPYARQTSVGWSHQVSPSASFSADYVRSDGRNLNVQTRLNSRTPAGPRRLAFVGLDPNIAGFRFVISSFESRYDGLLLNFRRRSSAGLDFAINYTLSRARSQQGQGIDETGLGANTIQDATNPYASVQYGPAASDARHLISASAIVQLPAAIQLSPVLFYRSALPAFIIENTDRNGDGTTNDIPDRAFAFDGVGRAPRDIGPCLTINCGRGAASTTFDVRVSRLFVVRGSRVNLIAEVFNLFNATNPSGFNTRRLVAGAPNRDLLQPLSFSGDTQQPVQRAGQIAIRWSF